MALVVILGVRAPAQQVVINEVHYNPPEGKELEFIELHNPRGEAVSLAGWRLGGGVRFTFPQTAVLAPGGYLVVARNAEALAQRFGLPRDRVLGDTPSNLDNGSEEVLLLDATGGIADVMEYDDSAPWSPAADGGGPSLQRLCLDFDPRQPLNWAAEPGDEPTPLAENLRLQCPPPVLPPPRVAINEIYYHPLEDRDVEEEFVELTNTTDEPVNLRGYAFTRGIRFLFEGDRVLEPGGYLVVCRNEEAVRAAFGIENTAGDFIGQLSNAGERITLVDAAGRLADSVRYADGGEWPVAADGLGNSLEKIRPEAPADDPASWTASQVVDLNRWRTASARGPATSDRLLLFAGGEAEFVIDNVRLVREGDPEGRSLFANGTFDTGLEGWDPRGNHSDTHWQEGTGPDGSGAMVLVAAGRGTGRFQGVSVETSEPLERSEEVLYVLSFDYLHRSGSTGLTVRLSGSSTQRGIHIGLGTGAVLSPGEVNGSLQPELPPFVGEVRRFPQEPTSQDSVWIRARVRGRDIASVRLHLVVNGETSAEPLLMHDDGLAEDGRAGDGIWGVELPPAAHSSAVTFRIEAASASGRLGFSPPLGDPVEVHGYYVNDDQPRSKLPVYHIILDQELPLPARSIIDRLSCSAYRVGHFAYRGDLYPNTAIRRRGGSVCGGGIVKKFLKLRFQRGREFRGLRKLNLQSLWTDKSLVRENLAWETFTEMGSPSCFHEFVRLHVNGGYFGLYAELEHPDKRYLERNGLDPAGNLYKATASREERGNIGGYEKKTNENGDFSDLRDFLERLHTTPPGELVSFFHENTDEDVIIEYQMCQMLTNNRDYPHKNHYLYHDLEKDRWLVTTWDMDLTFGKRWDGNYGGVLNDAMDNPGVDPWYTTRVSGGLGNHLLDKFFYQAGSWYRRAYLVRLWDALHERYTEELLDEKIEARRALLWEEQAEDIALWGRSPPTANDRTAPAEFLPNLERVRQHVQSRRRFLLNFLATRERFEGHDRLKITEVMYHPAGDSEDAEFLELWNNSGRAIDISGWSIAGLHRELLDGTVEEFVFPEGTRAEADEVFVVAKDPETFRRRYASEARAFGPYAGNLSNAGETLRVRDRGPGYPATVDFLRYGPDAPWPHRPDGLGYSLELTEVYEDRDNDLPENWRASIELNGTAGRIPRRGEPVFFERGNCNGDASLNVTDAVTILLHLFRGGEQPPCLDACDADADTVLTLTDGLYLLLALFGDEPLSIPFPGPGECARARGAFCEQSNCTAAE